MVVVVVEVIGIAAGPRYASVNGAGAGEDHCLQEVWVSHALVIRHGTFGSRDLSLGHSLGRRLHAMAMFGLHLAMSSYTALVEPRDDGGVKGRGDYVFDQLHSSSSSTSLKAASCLAFYAAGRCLVD